MRPTSSSFKDLPEEGRRLYAFVEGIAAPVDPEKYPRSRTSFYLDAVDADAFDDNAQSVLSVDFGFVVRGMTTPRRLWEMLGAVDRTIVDPLREGDWVEIEVKRQMGTPRAWMFDHRLDFDLRQPVNIVSARLMAPESDGWHRLEDACKTRDVRIAPADTVLGELATGLLGDDLRITALDVGQAACVAFHAGNRCVGYFDVGAPLYFHERSFNPDFWHVVPESGFVLLSHWDFDHYALALKRRPELKNLSWYAPEQPIGPSARRFQQALGDRLTLISGDSRIGDISLAQATGVDPRDRNATGYVMRIQDTRGAVLLTGDADYDVLPNGFAENVSALLMPHHTGGSSAPPPTFPGALAVASYGLPNRYRHPNEEQIGHHEKLGWRVQRTASHWSGSTQIPRQDRTLVASMVGRSAPVPTENTIR